MLLGAWRLKDRREGLVSIQVYRRFGRLLTVVADNGRKYNSARWHSQLGDAARAAVLRSCLIVMPIVFGV